LRRDRLAGAGPRFLGTARGLDQRAYVGPELDPFEPQRWVGPQAPVGKRLGKDLVEPLHRALEHRGYLVVVLYAQSKLAKPAVVGPVASGKVAFDRAAGVAVVQVGDRDEDVGSAELVEDLG